MTRKVELRQKKTKTASRIVYVYLDIYIVPSGICALHLLN